MANATANKTTGNKVLSEQKKNRIFEVLAEGIPFVDKSVTDLADEYLSKYHARELATKKLINNQILIVSSSGGLSGLVNSYSTSLVETAGKSLQAANISTALYLQITEILLEQQYSNLRFVFHGSPPALGMRFQLWIFLGVKLNRPIAFDMS